MIRIHEDSADFQVGDVIQKKRTGSLFKIIERKGGIVLALKIEPK